MTTDRLNTIEKDGVGIARTPNGVGVGWTGKYPPPAEIWTVEVYYQGRLIQSAMMSPLVPWRDYYHGVDNLQCVIIVRRGNEVLAELGLPPDELIHSFMVRTGEQRHVTESYVSVPPALTITDEVGAVWTLGLVAAAKNLSPDGEFAFDVLRDGVKMGEIASRIERRNGVVRIFTRHGWKRWLGRSF